MERIFPEALLIFKRVYIPLFGVTVRFNSDCGP